MSKPRASRIAAPGAQRIILTGIMAVSDDFDRIRVLLLDDSWKKLPQPSKDGKCPYTVTADSNDVRATVCVVVPLHRKKYWLQLAESLRGKIVTIEMTVRHFFLPNSETAGFSFDLAYLKSYQ